MAGRNAPNENHGNPRNRNGIDTQLCTLKHDVCGENVLACLCAFRHGTSLPKHLAVPQPQSAFVSKTAPSF